VQTLSRNHAVEQEITELTERGRKVKSEIRKKSESRKPKGGGNFTEITEGTERESL
jgi:hypothetical protein